MENKKVLNNEELEKVSGGANKDLEQQIEDALNEVVVPNPVEEKFQNKLK